MIRFLILTLIICILSACSPVPPPPILQPTSQPAPQPTAQPTPQPTPLVTEVDPEEYALFSAMIDQEASASGEKKCAGEQHTAGVQAIGQCHNRLRPFRSRHRSALARAGYYIPDHAEVVCRSCAVAAVLAFRTLFIPLHYWAGCCPGHEDQDLHDYWRRCFGWFMIWFNSKSCRV